MRQAVSTPSAPAAIGPVLTSDQSRQPAVRLGADPYRSRDRYLVPGDITQQTRRVFENLAAILKAADLTFDAVVRTTVYLLDMNEFAAMNEVYATFFTSPAPARATVQVARLPRDARVEIDIIAVL